MLPNPAAVTLMLLERGTKTAYIMLGSPWENGYCESFNGKLRNELLDGEIFYTHYEKLRSSSSSGDGITTRSGHTQAMGI
jgi:transposase InsO family protein